MKQLANEAGQELSVCLVEKGSEIGAHILSGAVIESRALDELFPDWHEMGAPLNVAVTEDELYLLHSAKGRSNYPICLFLRLCTIRATILSVLEMYVAG